MSNHHFLEEGITNQPFTLALLLQGLCLLVSLKLLVGKSPAAGSKAKHTTRVIRSPRFTNIKTENGWCGMIGMLWITTLLQHARPASNGQAQTRTCRCSSQIRAFSSQAMPITKPHKVAVGFFVCSKVHTQPSTIQQTNLIEDLTVPVAATNNIRLCPQQIPCARPHLLKHFQLFAVSCLLVLPLKGKHHWG